MGFFLSDLNGYKVAREINRQPSTKYIPIIFFTSKNKGANKAWELMCGLKTLLAPPYSKKKLLEEISKLIT